MLILVIQKGLNHFLALIVYIKKIFVDKNAFPSVISKKTRKASRKSSRKVSRQKQKVRIWLQMI